MVNIREYKYKKIDGSVLIGIELESKDENYYNNEIEVSFCKGEQVINQSTIKVPFLGGNDVFYVGGAYKINDFDDIKLELRLGKSTFEESYYPNVNLSIDKEKSTQRHLEYKFENNAEVPFDYAKLNLVFYNRGELVCGTSLKLENVMNGRAYYFTYDIPEEIDYTDINTELFIPNTNKLLFRGFYFEYVKRQNELDKLNNPLPLIDHEVYQDKSDEARKKIDEGKLALIRAKEIKGKKRKILDIFLFTFLFLLLGALVGVLLVIGCIILLVVASVFIGKINLTEEVALKIIIVGGLITFVAAWIVTRKRWKEYVSDEEKAKALKDAKDIIAEGEALLKDSIENKEKHIQMVEEKNKEIDEENKKIKEMNDKSNEKYAEKFREFEIFKSEYPKYSAIEKYDDIDKGLVNLAIEEGAITYDSVELYRSTARKQIDEDEKFREEMAMRDREVKAKEQQAAAIRANTLQSSIDASLMRDEVNRQTKAYQSAMYAQMAQTDALYKQKEYYGKQVTARLDELKYENYLNSKYL